MKVILAAAAVAASAVCAGRINLDVGWEYALKDDFDLNCRKVGMGPGGNNNGLPRVAEDTNGWRRVDLPHDWAVALPYASSREGARRGYKSIGTGYPTNSVAWYRKWFALPPGTARGSVYLQFDGVYRDAQFWLNGIYLGRNESGYIGRRFDVTDLLADGDAKPICDYLLAREEFENAFPGYEGDIHGVERERTGTRTYFRTLVVKK